MLHFNFSFQLFFIYWFAVRAGPLVQVDFNDYTRESKIGKR